MGFSLGLTTGGNFQQGEFIQRTCKGFIGTMGGGGVYKKGYIGYMETCSVIPVDVALGLWGVRGF